MSLLLVLFSGVAGADVAPPEERVPVAPAMVPDAPVIGSFFDQRTLDALPLDVTIDDQRVDIDVYPRLVDVHLSTVLHAGETGVASLAMGVPEMIPGWNEVPLTLEGETKTWREQTVKASRPLEALTVTVDGGAILPALVRRDVKLLDFEKFGHSEWWIWQVPLPPRATRRVETRYVQVLCDWQRAPNPMATRAFPDRPAKHGAWRNEVVYPLALSRLWKGAGGHSEITVTWHGEGLTVESKSGERTGQSLHWQFKDTAPEADLGISLTSADSPYESPLIAAPGDVHLFDVLARAACTEEAAVDLPWATAVDALRAPMAPVARARSRDAFSTRFATRHPTSHSPSRRAAGSPSCCRPSRATASVTTGSARANPKTRASAARFSPRVFTMRNAGALRSTSPVSTAPIASADRNERRSGSPASPWSSFSAAPSAGESAARCAVALGRGDQGCAPKVMRKRAASSKRPAAFSHCG